MGRMHRGCTGDAPGYFDTVASIQELPKKHKEINETNETYRKHNERTSKETNKDTLMKLRTGLNLNGTNNEETSNETILHLGQVWVSIPWC